MRYIYKNIKVKSFILLKNSLKVSKNDNDINIRKCSINYNVL